MFNEWANNKVKQMNWVDIGILKLCVFSFTLALVNFFPALLRVEWYFYGLVFTITYFYLTINMFGLKK